MDMVKVLLELVKFALALLVALLPLYNVIAQDTEKQERKLRLKIARTVNSEKVLVDTTITGTNYAEMVKGIKGLQIDTAGLRQLNSSSFKLITLDTVPLGGAGERELRFKKLSSIMSEADQRKVIMKLKDVNGDSALQGKLGRGKLSVAISGDSVRVIALKDVANLREAGVIRFARQGAGIVYKVTSDSVAGFTTISCDSLNQIRPHQIERVVIWKNGKNISADSLLQVEGNGTYRIIVDKDGGTKKVYRIDEQGQKIVLKYKVQEGNSSKATAFIFLKATVKDLTADDKEALQETGAKVESKKKEELAVEQISFYPNPSDGRFNLSFKLGNIGTTVVRVMDSNGEEVFVDTVEELEGEYNREINLMPFGPGLYYLQVAQGKKYHTKKILVK